MNKYIGSIQYGIRAFTVVDGVLWGALIARNMLVKISVDTGVMEFVDVFPYAEDADYLFSSVVYHEGKLIFAPLNADNIVVYCLASKSFSFIELRSDLLSRPDYRFVKAFMYEDIVYLIPNTYKAIVKLHLSDYSLEYITAPIDDIINDTNHMLGTDFFVCVTLDDSYFYAGCGCHTNRIIKYSLTDDTYEFCEVNNGNLGFAYWDNDTKIVSDYMERKTYIWKNEVIPVHEMDKFLVFDCVKTGNDIYVFSFAVSGKTPICKYKIREQKFEHIAITSGATGGVTSDGQFIYMIDNFCSKLIRINTGDDSVNEIRLQYADEIIEEKCASMKSLSFNEGEKSLNEYIEFCLNM